MTVALPELSEDQVGTVITEALSAGYFENDVEGKEITDPSDRQAAAKELVRQSILSYNAGNRNPGVMTILHIAEVDTSSAPPPTQGDETDMSVEDDLKRQTPEALAKFEEALKNYPPSDEVTANLATVRAEIERRQSASGQAPSNGHSAPTPAAAPAAEPAPVPVAETPADTGQNDEAAQRKTLEDRLTFQILRAHSIDPSQVGSLSLSELQWIVEHPAPEPTATAPEPAPQEQPAQAAQQDFNQAEAASREIGETIETTRMVITQQPEPVHPTLAEPQPEASAGSGISVVREELESQVTGPMLKAFGRGRKDVPGIGDNELRFMVENPEGRVSRELLDAARALDTGEEVAEPQPTAEAAPPSIADQERAEKAVQEVDGFAPGQQVQEENPTSAPSSAETDPTPAAAGSNAPVAASGKQTKAEAREPIPVVQIDATKHPENPAGGTISKENLPIPPEINEEPPRLPFDLSKSTDDELRSYHARFHACHSRTNYIVGLWEGELRDIVKLRKGEEVTAANAVPATIDRKRVTDGQREALAAADPQVVAYREQEHQIERILRQLTALRDGYSRDVSTCSRQWSMRHKESEGAGGLR